MNSRQHQFQDKRIAILGAGWLGRRIAEKAISLGMVVSALTRNPKTSDELIDLGVKCTITAKIQDDTWHSQIDLRQDYVVNCVSAGGGGLEGYRTSYLEGMKSILKWAGLQHPANFVYTGSTSVYPQTDGQTVDEKSSTEGTSESGSILLETEELLMEYSPFKNAAILRLGGLYGPNRHYLLNMLREGITEIPGRGDLQLNLLHLEDAASAVFAALGQSTGKQKYNVTDGNPVEKQKLVIWLAQQLGCAAPSFNPESQPKRSPIRRASGVIPSRKVDTSKIRASLGWTPEFPDFKSGYRNLLQDD